MADKKRKITSGKENETRRLFRTLVGEKGYANNEIYDETVPYPDINDLLNGASKDGCGRNGKPDFFVIKENKGKLIIVECKADIKNHKSKMFPDAKASELKTFFENNHKEITNYACDGVIWYAKFLKERYDVLCIAISGQYDNYELDTFYWKKKAKEYLNLNIKEIRKWDEYFELVGKLEKKQNDFKNFQGISERLNEDLRKYINLKEDEKPLFVSAILLALKADSTLKKSYDETDENGNYKLLDDNVDSDNKKDEALKNITLCNVLINDIITYLSRNNIKGNKIEALKSQFSFIEGREEFRRVNKELNKNPLRYFIQMIDEEVLSFFENGEFDALGQFYNTFLHYSGGDGKGLGIALTPSHITNLFADLANLNPKTKVLDICTGTGGVLVAAMHDMIQKAKCDKRAIEYIRKNNLIGIEMQPYMFALACSNMILRGDGKSNLYYSSCFDESITDEIKNMQPNVGMINPPYSQGSGLEEWRFIKHMLSMLTYGGTGIAIIPIGCFLKGRDSKLRKEILENNTLEAVMSMPENLFTVYGKNNVHTCICVFTAGKKHPEHHKTWFGYWRNDGFETSGGIRIDKYNKWEGIKNQWLKMYNGKDIIPEISTLGTISPDGDWTPENFLDIDYNAISYIDFKHKYRDYLTDRVLSLNLKELYDMKHDKIEINDIVDKDIRWDDCKSFKISDLFYMPITGSRSIESKVAQKNMNDYLREEIDENTAVCNFISAKNNSNGLCGKYIGEPEFKGRCLTVVKQGDGGKGITYYQQDDFCASNMVFVLRPKYERFNEYCGIYIATLIQKHRYKFSFNRPIKEDILSDLEIKLPYIKNGDEYMPDYEYMEKFIKSLLV